MKTKNTQVDFKLVSARDVERTYIDLLRNRKHSEVASIMTMSVSFTDNDLLPEYVKLSKPQDTLAVDNFGHRYGHSPMLSWRGVVPAFRHNVSEYTRGFTGKYVVLRKPFIDIPPINVIWKRSHIKSYVVGDRVMSLGGINCNGYSFADNIDVLLLCTSDKLQAFLQTYLEADGDLTSQGAGETISLDDHSDVLVDYGRPGKSPIMDSVLEDLQSADIAQVTTSSNFIPSGKIGRALKCLHKRGIQVTSYANRPSKYRPRNHSNFSMAVQWFVSLVTSVPWQDNLDTEFNHLKCVIITYNNGTKRCYVGSHNFGDLPVRFGTSEIVLRTAQQKLIQQLEKFIQTNLADSKTQV